MSISSSYILDRGSIWMIIHLDPDSNITAVEDHDHHAGGHVKPNNNETYEQLFVRLAQRRGFALDDIEQFLKTSKRKTRFLNPDRPANIAAILDTISTEQLKAALARRPNE